MSEPTQFERVKENFITSRYLKEITVGIFFFFNPPPATTHPIHTPHPLPSPRPFIFPDWSNCTLTISKYIVRFCGWHFSHWSGNIWQTRRCSSCSKFKAQAFESFIALIEPSWLWTGLKNIFKNTQVTHLLETLVWVQHAPWYGGPPIYSIPVHDIRLHSSGCGIPCTETSLTRQWCVIYLCQCVTCYLRLSSGMTHDLCFVRHAPFLYSGTCLVSCPGLPVPPTFGRLWHLTYYWLMCGWRTLTHISRGMYFW